jgi:hypothetical protein
VNIVPPTFSLKHERCPVCEGEGALCFFACPACSRLVLVCDEEFSVFAELRSANRQFYCEITDSACLCPGCGQAPITLFREATSEQILGAGFCRDEYE